jgi:1-deoxy-D-xylulose-5-phosphate synthase
MDRAGLVGNDGPTHMGLYDIAYLLAIPNITVTAPKDGAELLALLRLAIEDRRGPFSVRYPRDNAPAAVPPLDEIPAVPYGTWEVLRRGRGLALLAVGTMVMPALEAARELEQSGMDATVVNCRFLKPVDQATLEWILDRHSAVLTIEEGTVVNGFGAHMATRIEAAQTAHEIAVGVMGVPDAVIEHASRGEQLAAAGLTATGIAARARTIAARGRVPAVRETA